jgi:uncharacterized damage-inducible protein DinB
MAARQPIFGRMKMMDTKTAGMLARYNAWADQTFLEAVAKLPEDQIYRKTGTLFGSIVGTFNHNYQVDLIWQAHLLGKEHGFTTRHDVLHPKLADLALAQAEVDDWLIAWADEQTPESLDEAISFRFVSGKASTMQRGAVLLHLFNHKSYHRGWVVEMLLSTGAKPPQTDLSVYLCER